MKNILKNYFGIKVKLFILDLSGRVLEGVREYETVMKQKCKRNKDREGSKRRLIMGICNGLYNWGRWSK